MAGGAGAPAMNERHRWAASACLHLLIINVIFESPCERSERGGMINIMPDYDNIEAWREAAIVGNEEEPT